MNYDNVTNSDQHNTHADDISMHTPSPDTASPQSRRKVWAIVFGAVLLLLAAYLYVKFTSSDGSGDKQAPQLPTVSVIVPGQSTVTGEINVTGTLAARRPMPVGSVGEGGEIREIRVDAGDWVNQGQILAIIDRSVQVQAAASQAAQVDIALADARIAQANLDRGLKLVDRGFISKADIDQLTATRDAANARVNVAKATLNQLRAQNARLNIVAPASGFVLERKAELGQVVSGGSGVLFQLAKGGEMELLANVSENDLSSLSIGQSAKIIPVGSDKTFIGQIWQLSPVIDSNTRQGTARIALKFDPALRPGGFASAVIENGQVVAPMLPESAIQNDAKGAFVYVIGKGNKVVRRAVTSGTVTAKGITVTSGLNGDEKVVLRAGGFLSEGDTVTPRLVSTAN